jgi:low temperature requirement protein LtrA
VTSGPAEGISDDGFPADGLSADRFPVHGELTDGCPACDEPADSEPADNEPADSEPADSEPADNEPADSEPADSEPADSEPADSEPAPGADEPPLRVTTLELFFDLVFAFTLTQLAALLASGFTAADAARVLLIFGLLWWMYEGYAWLTNARPPVHTAERLLLLVGMAGFLTIGLAIPDGFGRSSLALGLGYLAVVIIHAWLYFRVNRNIIRVAPFNVASALLVTLASLLRGPTGEVELAGYLLWIAALAVQLGSPLIVHPKGLFELRPAHLSERHSALLLVALGESVAAIGVGVGRLAGHPGQDQARLIAAAVLGLALAATLWWIVFGGGDEEAAERVLTLATSERRTALALSAFFYGNIPLLLGLVATAAGVGQAIAHPGRLAAGPVGAAVALAAGAALFLVGDVAMRRRLQIGPVRLRAVAAALALATTAIGALMALEVQLIVITVLLVVILILERRESPLRRSGPGASPRPSAPASAPLR